MSKIGMIGGAALAITLSATVFYYHPSYASDGLLAKAQSEFATKARDALLQRRNLQAPAANVLAAAPQAEPAQAPVQAPAQTYVLASLEPASVSPAPMLETPEKAVVPVAQTATPEAVEAPVAATKLPETVVPVAVQSNENDVKPEVTERPAAAAAQNVEPQKTPEVAAPQVAAPQVVAPVANTAVHQPAKVVQKTTQEPVKTHDTVKKANTVARRSERATSREQLPYNVEALRSRAPEIAAALARYM